MPASIPNGSRNSTIRGSYTGSLRELRECCDRWQADTEGFVNDLRKALGERREHQRACLLIQVEEVRTVRDISVKCNLRVQIE